MLSVRTTTFHNIRYNIMPVYIRILSTVLYVLQTLPSMVELVPGYGVVLSQRQIDEAIDNSNNSPTRLIRHLISAFFTKEVLATSSALGGRKNNALDKDIVAACLSELINVCLTWPCLFYPQKYRIRPIKVHSGKNGPY